MEESPRLDWAFSTPARDASTGSPAMEEVTCATSALNAVLDTAYRSLVMDDRNYITAFASLEAL